MKRGLGLSLHTWGGRGHDSNCDVTIQPDGSVEVKLGSQDLGTGTRTCIKIVVAETLGLPLEAIDLKIGDSLYPALGRLGRQHHDRRRLRVLANRGHGRPREAPREGGPGARRSRRPSSRRSDGRIQVKGNPAKSLAWAEACAKLGGVAVTARGTTPKGQHPLLNSGVGGVQMADVSVDVETGRVRVNKLVAVQDCGLVIDLKMAESQCYGALIMGISYALYEEKVTDRLTGRMLNPNMEFYKLAGLADIGELVVHMMTGKGYDERGVIGLGEPPVISPGAAISNAVANAIGVRVPHIPLTPRRVLAALEGRRA